MKTPEEFLEENNFTVAEKIDRQAMIATFTIPTTGAFVLSNRLKVLISV